MRYYKLINDGYLIAVGTGAGGTEISAEEHAELRDLFKTKPTAEIGFDYKLTSNLMWVKVDAPIAEEETTYTEEQLTSMNTNELKSILAGMGISGSMTKANMIALILLKQAEE